MLIARHITYNVMSDTLKAAFGLWFQSEREKTGVSQGDATKKAEMHVIQLSRIENGHSGIKRPTLERLVAAINELSSGHKIDLNDALKRAGFAWDDGLSLEIADDVRVSMLHGKKLSNSERERFKAAFKTAYAMAKQSDLGKEEGGEPEDEPDRPKLKVAHRVIR